MSLTVFLLVVISAALHAGWNLLGKKVNPSTGFFTLAFLAGVLPLTPLALVMLWVYPQLVQQILPLLLLSGIFQAVYTASLALAYRSGEISIAYPLARALPVLLVALFSAMLALETLSGFWSYIGIGLLLLGAMLLPMRHLKDFQISHYLSKSTLFALLAAVGTAGYSLSDKAAIDQLKLGITEPALVIAIFYIWLEGISATLCLLLGQCWHPQLRRELLSIARLQGRAVFITGCMITLTYMLVLWAMQHADNLSYVVALRQISIPIGALLGVLLFREFFGITKITALILLCTGLALVILS